MSDLVFPRIAADVAELFAIGVIIPLELMALLTRSPPGDGAPHILEATI